MLIGYARVSKNDGSQLLDLQMDALVKAGVKDFNIYTDKMSGAKDDREGLKNCLRAIRKNDVLVIWKLDRLGRSTRHLLKVIDELREKGVDLKILSDHGAGIDTTTAGGKLIFSMFAMFAEFERNLIRERVKAGLNAARARGRCGGRPHKLTPAQLRIAQSGMKSRDISIAALCRELGITTATIYKYMDNQGNLRQRGITLLNNKQKRAG